MDADDTQTWISSGCKKSRDDNFFKENSAAPIKSRAALILTEVEEDLEAKETEYNSVKTTFEYMKKMICLEAGKIRDSHIVASPISETSDFPLDPVPNSPLKDERQTQRHTSPEKPEEDLWASVHRVQSPKCSARSYKVSPRQDIYLGARGKSSNDFASALENYFSEEASSCGGEKSVVCEETLENKDVRIPREDGFRDVSTNRTQHPRQIHLPEYSKDIDEDAEEINTPPAERAREMSFVDLPRSARRQRVKRQELFLNLSGNMECVEGRKIKKSRMEKQQQQRRISDGATSSSYKKNRLLRDDDTLCGPASKIIRRKKRRLKASNSRSTTATRDTPGGVLPPTAGYYRKDTKKRKQRGDGTATAPSAQSTQERHVIATKLQKNWSEVVEIYHNDAPSVVSSKHSRLEPRPETELRRSFTSLKNSQPIDHKEHRETLQDATDLRSAGERAHDEPHNRNPESPERPSGGCYCDPLIVRNYELPTLASKMKRVNRSYLSRFNFRNIPFVVGTSVSPSYNLGLNIQQTLSLIKTRQIMPSGVTPLLMSKVSKGVKPFSTLLGCSEDRDGIFENSAVRFDASGRTATTNMQLGTFSFEIPRLSSFRVPSAEKRKTRSNFSSSIKLNSQNKGQQVVNVGDTRSNNNWQSVPRNVNGIRDVLVNFHDQFEAMNLKYEKLQEQAEKSTDESLRKEIATLEKELSSKEEEINAVVNLYKEVMVLKRQMKLLYERNSLVCVATESSENPPRKYPEIPSRGHGANLASPMSNLYGRCGAGSAKIHRGPSTATRLAGLLRQIKIFQKELKSAS